jgi:hypothetical protein
VTHLLTWLAAHYVKVGEYLLSAAAALVIAILGAALPLLGLAARWPRRITALTGVVLVVLGGVLALAKALRPDALHPLPWLAPAITAFAGAVFILTACSLGARHRLKTRQRLQPMADAAFRTIDVLINRTRTNSFARLETSNGQPAVDEILSRMRRKQPGPLLLIASPGAGKTCTLISVATKCQEDWVERRSSRIIPVYIDIARLAKQVTRPPIRDYITSQIAHDAKFISQLNEAWSDERTNVTWLFLFDNADHAIMRWNKEYDGHTWTAELHDFLNTNPTGLRAVLAGRDLSSISGTRIELAPLSAKARVEFMSSRGVSTGWSQPVEAIELRVSSGLSARRSSANTSAGVLN